MSLNSLFSTARASLLASQAATQATSQNVANVETPGYSRRTVALRSLPATRGGIVVHSTPSAGAGVGVESFDRSRSAILDAAARRGQAGSSGAGEGAVLLAGLESQLTADGGDQLLGAVGQFFDAWGDLASAPSDGGTRDALLAKASHLAQTLGSADERLQQYGSAVQNELADTVGRANTIFAEVAGLNKSIQSAQSQGANNADALDRRDLLLDELAGLAPIDVRAQPNGGVTVSIHGLVAVQDSEARPLQLALPPAAPSPSVSASGAPGPLRLDALEGGALGAQLHLLNTALPDARTSLDALAADVVTRVNAAHTAGEGLDGVSGRSFFDPAGVTASSMALSTDVANPDHVAAGNGGPGDSRVATAISGLAESANGATTGLLARIGAEVRTAAAASEGNAAVTAYAEALRDGVSRVSLDEEMTNLIRYQQAYAASARVLQTAESLFDTLLTI